MKSKTNCPICDCKIATLDEEHDDVGGLTEWEVKCPKCKFQEHWAYGSWVKFKKPKLKYRRKFKKYLKETLGDD